MKSRCYIRFDDICPTMDREEFSKALDLMEKYRISPLLAIIPENLDEDQNLDAPDPEFWSKMRELQTKGYTLALHGLNHIYHCDRPKTIVCGRKHSEFAGLSLEEQERMIRRGIGILREHGIETDVFVAPAHTYDRNTLIALRNCGFHYLSDGFSAKPYREEGIVCVPCPSFGVPARLRHPIEAAVNHPSEWKKKGKENGPELLDAFCRENRDRIVGFDELTRENPGAYLVQKGSECRNLSVLRLKRAVRKILVRKGRKR